MTPGRASGIPRRVLCGKAEHLGGNMAKETNFWGGLFAGVAGGVAAAWIMNEFIAGPGQKMQAAITRAEGRQPAKQDPDEVDSTAKVADTAAVMATGGQHLTFAQKQKGGSVVHYAFGGTMGGLYGVLAEYLPAVKGGFGTTYATALFTVADVIAVPALNLSKPASEQDPASLAEYYAAHLVYGVSTEFVRRVVRKLF